MIHLVRVRYLGPTSYRGSRLRATWLGAPSTVRPVTQNRDYAVSVEAQEVKAALAALQLCRGRHALLARAVDGDDSLLAIDCSS